MAKKSKKVPALWYGVYNHEERYWVLYGTLTEAMSEHPDEEIHEGRFKLLGRTKVVIEYADKK